MLEGILSKSFYGNTIGVWTTALLIIVAALVVGKALYWLCSTVLRKATAHSTSKLDDIILDMIEEPTVFAIAVVGIWYGISRLEFPDSVDGWIWNGIQFLIVLSVTWLIARLLNSLFCHFLSPLAEKSENDLDDQLLPIVRKGTTFTVWALGVIVALNIMLIYHITSGADIVATQTDVNLEILRRFAAENLEFAFPTQTLYTIDQAGSKAAPHR